MDNASAKEMLVDAEWYAETLHKLVEVGMKEEKYRWHDLRKDPKDLPPSRGSNGEVPDSYDMVVRFECDDKDHTVVTMQGQGWLNDAWKDKKGFLLIAKQVSDRIAFYPDKPVPFSYDQLIAWREIEPFEEN